MEKQLQNTNEKKLSLVSSPFSKEQIIDLMCRTPKRYIYTRKGKGGKDFKYVPGGYVRKKLNWNFGFLWDFKIKEHGIQGNQVWVLGQLRIKEPKTFKTIITKEQFGRADIKFYQDKSKGMLDFGNDLKSAGTDALKKCGAELGIASDIYYENEWNEIRLEKDVIVDDKNVNQEPKDDKLTNIQLLKKIIPGKTDKEKIEKLKKYGIKLTDFNITQKHAEIILKTLKQNNGNKNNKKS